MAGSSWPTLTAGAVARASDVNAHFAWLEGSIVPQSGGFATDNTYDLGSVTTNWRTIYAYSINGTSTAKGLAIGTTTVANQSDVALEIAGSRAMVMPRLTTAQRTALAGINGMEVYDSTANQFYVYENGSWKVMLGSPIGFVAPVFASTTSLSTVSALAVSAPGRLRMLTCGPQAASQGRVEVALDSVIWGDIVTNTSTIGYLAMAHTSTANTAATLMFSSSPSDWSHLDLYFKTSMNVYYYSTGGNAAQIGIWYERT